MDGRYIFSVLDMPQKILVTGATGKLGEQVGRMLLKKYRIFAFYRDPSKIFLRKEIKWVKTDILDLSQEAMEAIRRCDMIVHLAGQMGSFNRFCFKVNVEGTRNILKAIDKERKTTFIFFSSIDAFGMTGKQVVDEEDMEEPDSLYGESKLRAERLIKLYATENKNFEFVILRLGNVDMEGVLQRTVRIPVVQMVFRQNELSVVRTSVVLRVLADVIGKKGYRNLTRFLTEKSVSIGGDKSMVWWKIDDVLAVIMRLLRRGGLWFYLLMGGSRKPYRRYSGKIFEELNWR